MFDPGRNVGIGSDFTLFAFKTGKAKFSQSGNRKRVSIEAA